MQDVDAGIPLDTHMCYKENKAYKLCFTGENILDNYPGTFFIYSYWLEHTDLRSGNLLLQEFKSLTGCLSGHLYTTGMQEGTWLVCY